MIPPTFRPAVARFWRKHEVWSPLFVIQVIFIVVSGCSNSLFSLLSLIEYHGTVLLRTALFLGPASFFPIVSLFTRQRHQSKMDNADNVHIPELDLSVRVPRGRAVEQYLYNLPLLSSVRLRCQSRPRGARHYGLCLLTTKTTAFTRPRGEPSAAQDYSLWIAFSPQDYCLYAFKIIALRL